MKAIIIDDERMIRTGIMNVIPWKDLGIEEVYTAETVHSALFLLRQHHADIIIIDMDMEGGRHVIEQARSIDASMRIIALTSHARLDFVRECHRLNIQDFLRKPIDDAVLTKMVRKQVELIKKEQADYYKLGEKYLPQETRKDLFRAVFNELKFQMCSSEIETSDVMKLLQEFQQAAMQYGISDRMYQNCCSELVFAVYRSENRPIPSDYLNKFSENLAGKTRKEIQELTRSLLVERLEKNEDDNHDAVRFAKQYIKEHLDEDLSVAGIAGILFLTPNYFSRLFKRNAGIGCNEYIVRERICKAKDLLIKTDMKTGRIAGMVGYKDTNYFSLAFKKNVGISPRGFREQYRSE